MIVNRSGCFAVSDIPSGIALLKSVEGEGNGAVRVPIGYHLGVRIRPFALMRFSDHTDMRSQLISVRSHTVQYLTGLIRVSARYSRHFLMASTCSLCFG